MGDISVELYLDECPWTAGNFINLTVDGFYDGLLFHRVIEDFVVQGGCPNGDGTGGPGYTIKDEDSALGLEHDNGALSMASYGTPDTAGSQFFIVVDPEGEHHLDGTYLVFGKVVGGMDVAVAISEVATDGSNKPVVDIVMERVVISNLDEDQPVAKATAPSEVLVGRSAWLDGTSSTGNGLVVNWTWTIEHGGDQLVLYGEELEYQFEKTGKYKIELTIRDVLRNTDSDKLTVEVKQSLDKGLETGTLFVLVLVIAIVVAAVMLVLTRRKKE